MEQITRCCQDSNATSGGFKWKYIQENIETKIEIKLEQDEIFKTIDSYKGYSFPNYQISNYGKIKNTKTNKFLIPPIVNGYYYISLYNSKNKRITCKIHRLVAHFFIAKDNGNNKLVVNHKDEKTLNNYYKNLEWSSNRDNIVYSCGKAVYQLDKNTEEILNKFDCLKDAYISLNRKVDGSITSCCKGKTNTAYGYKWKFV